MLPSRLELLRGRLELVPAWSHKPFYVGSNPTPATIVNGQLEELGRPRNLVTVSDRGFESRTARHVCGVEDEVAESPAFQAGH